jgi:predicted dehydrogenase
MDTQMSKPLGIGVIGLGYWGPNLVRNFSQQPGVRVVVGCDLEEERRRHIGQLYPHVETTSDPEEVLRNPEVDAVCVATPVATHFDLARSALQAGKCVWVEKPLAASVVQARELGELARKQGRILFVDHTYLYASPVRALRERVLKGNLGQILYLHSVRVNLGLFQKDINVVWDLAAHDIAIMNYLLGADPRAVNVAGSWHYREGIEDVAFVTLHYPGRVQAHLHLSWLDPCKIRRLTIVGDTRMAVYDDLDGTEPIRIYDKGVSKQPYYDDYSEFKLIYRFGDVMVPHLETVEPLKTAVRHFVDCVRSGEEPLTGAASGISVIRVLEAAQRSVKDKGRLEEVQRDASS